MGDVRGLPTVLPLQWADDRPMCRVRIQKDGQIEFYTTCGRYVIRERKTPAQIMWVARYLTNGVVAAETSIRAAKAAAQSHHEQRVLMDIGARALSEDR